MTTDITLRPINASDIEQIRMWRNSPEVAQFMYTEKEISAEDQQRWFAGLEKDATKKYWLIEYEGRPLGVANLYNIHTGFRTCYWAFYLGDTTIRNAGIGSKVEFRVLDHVFGEMNFNKLLCEVFVTNDKVIKMHEKFGFRRESYFREQIIKNGEALDVVGLAMLQREWQLIKETHQQRIYGEAKVS